MSGTEGTQPLPACEAPRKDEPGSGSAGDGVEELETRLPSTSAAVHEVIRRDGDKELGREAMALLWSAIAGGITMSTSFMARGILAANLPATDFGFLIEAMGYTLGFLLVIAANQQLFTENTVTAVLPFMTRPDRRNFQRLLRLWGVVLAGNSLGALVAAGVFAFMPVFPAEVSAAFVEIGHHLVEKPVAQMLGGGIISGWLIATMVWALYATPQSKFAIIFLATYLIAIGDFPHVIVGTVEVLYLVLNGELGLVAAVLHFWLPVLAGNVIGGTLIFALISHAQVRADRSGGGESLPVGDPRR